MSDRVNLGLGDDGRIHVSAGVMPAGISWLTPQDAKAAGERLLELAAEGAAMVAARAATHAPEPEPAPEPAAAPEAEVEPQPETQPDPQAALDAAAPPLPPRRKRAP